MAERVYRKQVNSLNPSILCGLDPGDVEIVPLYGFGDVFDEYRASWGVVEYCLVRFADSVAPVVAHRVAAAAVIAEVTRYWQERAAKGGYQMPGVNIDIEDATCESITVERWVGHGYDWSTGEIIPITQRWDDEYATDGYAAAFAFPAYPMNVSLEQTTDWFRTINARLFGGFDDDLIVYKWSTDWSSFFDSGHEWWGSFCWTVQQPGSPFVAALAASTTD